MNDLEIIELYNKRDEVAIKETDRAYGPYLYAVAFNVLRNKEDSEESVSDGYLKTWNAIPPAKPNKLKAFIAKIVRNTAIDKYLAKRAEKRGAGEVDLCLDELSEIAEGSAEDALLEQEKLEELTRVINDFLKEKKKTDAKAFIRRYWYMNSIADIARSLNVSESSVKVSLFRMRKELKDLISKEGI